MISRPALCYIHENMLSSTPSFLVTINASINYSSRWLFAGLQNKRNVKNRIKILFYSGSATCETWDIVTTSTGPLPACQRGMPLLFMTCCFELVNITILSYCPDLKRRREWNIYSKYITKKKKKKTCCFNQFSHFSKCFHCFDPRISNN